MPEHTEQSAPLHRPGVPSIQAAVRADLEARERLGIERYGTPLQPHNGRDGLRDAYEEALDLVCCLRQALGERSVQRDASRERLVGICEQALRDSSDAGEQRYAVRARRLADALIETGMPALVGPGEYDRGWRDGYSKALQQGAQRRSADGAAS